LVAVVFPKSGEASENMLGSIHVVDGDGARRAQIARQLYAQQYHVEIYESLDELLACPPRSGAILIHDGVRPCETIATVRGVNVITGCLPVAFFSPDPSPRRIVEAMAAGAIDYLEWPCSAQELAYAMTQVLTLGEQRARLEKRKLQAKAFVKLLSPRERDVLRELVAGGSNKDIAKRLGISPRTVEIHRANAMGRLNAGSVADAVRIGVYAGLDE
jgi:two-component system, LuxR family, response regulator FixJ